MKIKYLNNNKAGLTGKSYVKMDNDNFYILKGSKIAIKESNTFNQKRTDKSKKKWLEIKKNHVDKNNEITIDFKVNSLYEATCIVLARSEKVSVWKESYVNKIEELRLYDSSDEIQEEYYRTNEVLKKIEILSKQENKYKEIVIKQRIGQGKFREGLLKVNDGKCVLCDVNQRELLIASHIKSWSDSSIEEATDLNNGLLLCANHDKLFDNHLISFDVEGNMLISNKIANKSKKILNIGDNLKIKLNDEQINYMSTHRDIFEKNKL